MIHILFKEIIVTVVMPHEEIRLYNTYKYRYYWMEVDGTSLKLQHLVLSRQDSLLKYAHIGTCLV